MENLFTQLRLVDVHTELLRNIVSLRITEHLFDDLTDDPTGWNSAQLLELSTKPNFFTGQNQIINRPFEEAEWNEAIQYPFKNSSQSRYSDGTFGVWYGADTLETTVNETIYHWRNKLLGDAEGFLKPGVRIERRVFSVRCDAALIDLRMAVEQCPQLIDQYDYTQTHSVGRKMHHEGHPGLISKSARGTGDVYAIFTSRVLSNPHHSCYLTYTIAEHGEVVVEKQVGETFMIVE